MESFSVLLSVYKNDSPDWLNQALKSICDQTIKPIEVVIVFDGPVSQNIEAVVNNYAAKLNIVIKRMSRNMGLGRALNFGLQYVRTDLVARVDADDINQKDRFKLQLSMFESDKQLALCGGNVAEFLQSEDNVISNRVVPTEEDDIRTFSQYRCPFNHPTVMFRKKAIEHVGGYQHVPLFEDYHLWVRVLLAGYKVANVNETLVKMRVSDDLYNRRGGMKYFLNYCNLKKDLKNWNWITRGQYLGSVVAMFLSALLPNYVRKAIYTRVLRKESNSVI